MSNKNIILCADGTGNLGGTTPDTNVYRLFNMVDIHDPNYPQMTYYDNGVGTAANKYWRMLSGAFGFGFKRNVCEMYEFLARNYVDGDRVFLFGFSRGAAEIRALSGMIASAGLCNGAGQSESVIEENVKKAYRYYRDGGTGPLFLDHGIITLTCIGVWDTVSALGFPKDWRVTGIGMWLLNLIFYTLDHVFDWIFPHNFYNYELTSNVQHAYHALAIDDERLSFTPKIWNENKVGAETSVEQVWFGGAHSNVGGGYGRAGLSYIALQWMISKILPLGVRLFPGALNEINAKANAYGRMYNARDGFGVFYRYYPRKLSDLCKGKLQGTIQIHQSVLARIKRFTEHYAPGYLPKNFTLVETPTPGTTFANSKEIAIANTEWDQLINELDTWTFRRSWLYGLFLELTLFIVGTAFAIWVWPERFKWLSAETWTGWGSSGLNHVAEILKYVLPEMFDGFISIVVLQRPIIFLSLLGIFLMLLFLKNWTRKNYRLVCESIREVILKSFPEKQTKKPMVKDQDVAELVGK